MVIIQMTERVGFTELVDKLDQLDLTYKLELVPESLYDQAKQVYWLPSRGNGTTIKDTNKLFQRRIIFPPEVLQASSVVDTLPKNDAADSADKKANGDIILKTSRELFSILTIRAR